MLTAISRYGARVVANTVQRINALEQQGQLVEGPHIAAFETAFAARLGGVHAVSTSYGRMAFFYILRALEFPPGSEIIMPALTFWVMPEIARQAGLVPVFADVDPVTFNITAATVERVVTPRTVAIVPTHMWGLPCDMDPIVELARRHGLQVIEDCAHALGATYRGRRAGTLGDAAIFSFQTLKPLNAYGGGMAVVRDSRLAARVARLAEEAPPPSVRRIKERLWRGRVLRIATRPPVFTWTLFPLLYAGQRLHWNVDMYFWERIRPSEDADGLEGVVSCGACEMVMRHPEPGCRCPRCDARIDRRIPDALSASIALTLAGMLLYIPANLYAIARMPIGLKPTSYTILGGVIELVDVHLIGLAALVFIASFAIPVFKLIGLAWCIASVLRRSTFALSTKTKTYRIVEEIGRWSMVDPFVVACFVPVTQYNAAFTSSAEPAATYFTAVVVLTMMAAHVFDPRLMWDAARGRIT